MSLKSRVKHAQQQVNMALAKIRAEEAEMDADCLARGQDPLVPKALFVLMSFWSGVHMSAGGRRRAIPREEVDRIWADFVNHDGRVTVKGVELCLAASAEWQVRPALRGDA